MSSTAQVIPFRPRIDAVAVPEAEEGAERRLARALASLDAALDEQQAAMDRFRLAIGDLGRAVASLESGLVRYGDELACIGHDVERLAIEARALEAWADQALARAGQGSGGH